MLDGFRSLVEHCDGTFDSGLAANQELAFLSGGGRIHEALELERQPAYYLRKRYPAGVAVGPAVTEEHHHKRQAFRILALAGIADGLKGAVLCTDAVQIDNLVLEHLVAAAGELDHSPDRPVGRTYLQGDVRAAQLLEKAVHGKVQGGVVVRRLDEVDARRGLALFALGVDSRNHGPYLIQAGRTSLEADGQDLLRGSIAGGDDLAGVDEVVSDCQALTRITAGLEIHQCVIVAHNPVSGRGLGGPGNQFIGALDEIAHEHRKRKIPVHETGSLEIERLAACIDHPHRDGIIGIVQIFGRELQLERAVRADFQLFPLCGLDNSADAVKGPGAAEGMAGKGLHLAADADLVSGKIEIVILVPFQFEGRKHELIHTDTAGGKRTAFGLDFYCIISASFSLGERETAPDRAVFIGLEGLAVNLIIFGVE